MEKQKNKDLTDSFYKLAYGLFVLLALYQVLLQEEWINAASSMGIALIFDPFGYKIAWNNRPLWQKIWLFTHLGIAAALLGFGIGFFEK